MEKIIFTGLGACQEVGRSSFLIEAKDHILLDRGVKLNPELTEYPLPVTTNLDAVLISHAHLDHSGDLPHLFLTGNPLTYLTQETLELSELLWHDTLKIAGFEGMDANFSKEEINRTKHYSFPLTYKKEVQITENTSIELRNAGHILGAAITKFYFKKHSLIYTGDFRVEDTRLMPEADLNFGSTDFLIIESTYGDRNHDPRKIEEKKLIEAVKNVTENNGIVLIAAFAVGRSEEILDILFEGKISVPVYFDGMGQKAARISLKHQDKLRNPKRLEQALENAVWIKKDKQRKEALKQPCVIVSTAGMLGGGPIMFYLQKLWNDPSSALFLSGYQVKGTVGRKLLEENILDLPQKSVRPNLLVKQFDFSGHASQSEMIKAIKKWSPQKILLVHGDKEVMPVFKQKIIEETGIETIIPEINEKIVLSE